MDINIAATGRGWNWISEGFALFRMDPLIWIVNLLIFSGIMVVLPLIPVVGSLAAMLLQPVLLGGMLIGCRALDQGEELRIEHLFDGFRQNTKALLMVGLLSTVAYASIFIVMIVVLSGGLGLGRMAELATGATPAMPQELLAVLLAGLVGVSLSLPIAMASWFAPSLVVFDNLQAWDALKTSFVGCLRNFMPFMLYGLVGLLLCLLAAITLGLGFLVLAPTLIASVYTAYRDIF